MRRLALIVLAVLLATDIALLISDRRVLVWETHVRPGETYEVPDWGDLGKSSGASVVCRYFTGRSIKVRVFHYSPNNILGRDSCPFLALP